MGAGSRGSGRPRVPAAAVGGGLRGATAPGGGPLREGERGAGREEEGREGLKSRVWRSP